MRDLLFVARLCAARCELTRYTLRSNLFTLGSSLR